MPYVLHVHTLISYISYYVHPLRYGKTQSEKGRESKKSLSTSWGCAFAFHVGVSHGRVCVCAPPPCEVYEAEVFFSFSSFDFGGREPTPVNGLERFAWSSFHSALGIAQDHRPERLWEAERRLSDVSLKVLDYRLRERQLCCLLQNSFFVEAILHHELREISHHLRARRHLGRIPCMQPTSSRTPLQHPHRRTFSAYRTHTLLGRTDSNAGNQRGHKERKPACRLRPPVTENGEGET